MSRKEAAKQVIAGNVLVNGKLVKDPGFPADEKAEIIIQGKKATKEKHVYLLFNKPANCVTTRNDPEGRKTIYDFLKTEKWLFPAGRLDYGTSGLLILTNDTAFSDFITNPDSGIEKTYVAKIKPLLKDAKELEKPLIIGGKMTKPAKARIISSTDKASWIELSISEGKNRQARRIIEATGRKVISLKRIAIGLVRDDSLKPGESRELKREEIVLLKKLKR